MCAWLGAGRRQPVGGSLGAVAGCQHAADAKDAPGRAFLAQLWPLIPSFFLFSQLCFFFLIFFFIYHHLLLLFFVLMNIIIIHLLLLLFFFVSGCCTRRSSSLRPAEPPGALAASPGLSLGEQLDLRIQALDAVRARRRATLVR